MSIRLRRLRRSLSKFNCALMLLYKPGTAAFYVSCKRAGHGAAYLLSCPNAGYTDQRIRAMGELMLESSASAILKTTP